MVGLEIKLEFPKWAEKLEAKRQEINEFVAAMMQTNRGMLFDREGAYNGHPKWKPLVFRTGMILSNRGILRRSIAPINPDGKPGPGGIVSFSGESITIGTRVAYAALMNEGTANLPGGVLRPVNAKALMIPLPAGKKATQTAKDLRKGSSKSTREGAPKNERVIFRKSVRIPARRFDQWNEADQQELGEALRNKIVQVLNAT